MTFLKFPEDQQLFGVLESQTRKLSPLVAGFKKVLLVCSVKKLVILLRHGSNDLGRRCSQRSSFPSVLKDVITPQANIYD
jgi:hypothetical protein